MDDKICCRCYCKIRLGQPYERLGSTGHQHLNYSDCIKELLWTVDARDAQIAQLQAQLQASNENLKLFVKADGLVAKIANHFDVEKESHETISDERTG